MVPLLLLQGAEDPIIGPGMTQRFAERGCGAGASVDLRIIPGVGHFTLSHRTADDAVAWTQDRFAGLDPPRPADPLSRPGARSGPFPSREGPA